MWHCGHKGGMTKLIMMMSIATVRETAVLKSNESESGRLIEWLKSPILIDTPLCNKLILLRSHLLIIGLGAPAKKAS
jgi:hypothetical protein